MAREPFQDPTRPRIRPVSPEYQALAEQVHALRQQKKPIPVQAGQNQAEYEALAAQINALSAQMAGLRHQVTPAEAPLRPPAISDGNTELWVQRQASQRRYGPPPSAPAPAPTTLDAVKELWRQRDAARGRGGPSGEANPFANEPPHFAQAAPAETSPASWAHAEGLGLKFGLRPAQTAQILAQIGLRPETFRQEDLKRAQEHLYQAVTPGFLQARAHWTGEQRRNAGVDNPDFRESFPSEIAWGRSTSYRQAYFASARYVTRDAQGEIQLSPGYVHRKGTPTEVPYSQRFTAWPAVNAQGQQMTTLDISTPKGQLTHEKRQQQWGRHELAELSGLTSFQGIPEGPGSGRGNTYQRAQIFSVLGGAPGVAGTSLLSPSVGVVQKRFAKVLVPEEGQPLGDVIAPGQYRVGQQVRLAANLAPMRLSGWNMDVEETRPYVEDGHEGQIVGGRLWARPDQQLLANKYGGAKGLERVLGAEPQVTLGGQPVQATEINELKELQGKVQAIFQGEWDYYQSPAERGRIAQELGFGSLNEMYAQVGENFSYAQIGERAFARFQQHAFQRNEQGEVVGPGRYASPIQYTFDLHESQLPHWQGALVGTPTPLGGGMLRATAEWWALHSPIENGQPIGEAVRYSLEPPGQGRAFMPLRELERLQAAEAQGLRQPGLYDAIMRASGRTRASYRSVINAALASSGEFQAPASGLNIRDPEFQRAVIESQLAAQANVAARSGGGAVSQRAVVSEFFRRMRVAGRMTPSGERVGGYSQVLANRPLVAETAYGTLHLPPLARLARFGHEGPYAGQEVSRYLTGAYNLLTGTAAGTLQEDQFSRLRDIQARLAESVNVKRGALGAFVPRNLGVLARGVYNPALPEGSFWARGLAGQTATVGRSPSTGVGMYAGNLAGQGLTNDQAQTLGIDPRSTAVHLSGLYPGVASGDVDADFYQLLAAAEGVSPDQLAAMGAAVQENVAAGRGNPISEIAPRLGLQEAGQRVLGAQLRPVSQAQAEASARGAHDLYSYISRTYSPDLQMEAFAVADRIGQRAVARLGSTLYGTGQVPQRLSEPWQNVLDVQNLSPGGAIYEQWNPASKRRAAFRGPLGALLETVSGYRRIVEEGGYPADLAGAMLAPNEAARGPVSAAMTQAAQAAQAARGQLSGDALRDRLAQIDYQAALPIIQGAGGMDEGPANWLVSGSYAGRHMGALIARRAQRNGGERWVQFPVSDTVRQGMLQNLAQMTAHQALRSKRTPAAEMARAARAEGMTGFVAPLDAEPLRPEAGAAVSATIPAVSAAPARAQATSALARARGTGWVRPKQSGAGVARAAATQAAAQVQPVVSAWPAIPAGHARVTHVTNEQAALAIQQSGLDYSGRGMISSTTDVFSQNEDLDTFVRTGRNGPFDRRSFGDRVVVLDMPFATYRRHNQVGAAPGRVEPGEMQFVGSYPAGWANQSRAEATQAAAQAQPQVTEALRPENVGASNRHYGRSGLVHAPSRAGIGGRAQRLSAGSGGGSNGSLPPPAPAGPPAGNGAPPAGPGGPAGPPPAGPADPGDPDMRSFRGTIRYNAATGTGAVYGRPQGMSVREIRELQQLAGGVQDNGQGGFLGQMGQVFQRVLAGERFQPGYEGELYQWANRVAAQLGDWSYRTQGAYPAQAQTALQYLQGPLDVLARHNFERKFATPKEREGFEPPALAFNPNDPARGPMSDGLRREIEARERLIQVMRDQEASGKELHEQDKKYLAQTALASPKAMDALGRVRAGVAAARERGARGEDLTEDDVKAIVAGRKHLAPDVRGDADTLFGLFGPEGLEPERGRRGGGRGGRNWGGGGGVGRYGGLGGLGWMIFEAQRAWHWTGGALLGWEQQYATAEMGMQQAAFQAGKGGLELQGAPLQLANRRSQASLAVYNLGAATNRTWGSTIDSALGLINNAPEGRQDDIVKAMGVGGAAIGGLAALAGARWAGRLVAPLAGAIATPVGSLLTTATLAAGGAGPTQTGAVQAHAPEEMRGLAKYLTTPVYDPATGNYRAPYETLGIDISRGYPQPKEPPRAWWATQKQGPGEAAGWQWFVQTYGNMDGVAGPAGIDGVAGAARRGGALARRVSELTFNFEGDNSALFQKFAGKENGAYTVEETTQAAIDFAKENGRPPNEEELRRVLGRNRMTGGTGFSQQTTDEVAGRLGLVQGTEEYTRLGQQMAGTPQATQGYLRQAAGIWGPIWQAGGLEPGAASRMLPGVAQAFQGQLGQMSLYVPQAANILTSRGFAPPVNFPEQMAGLQTRLGVTPTAMGYMAGMYDTFEGWSLRQPVTQLAGGGWQAGGLEGNMPGWEGSTQSLGTAARFGLQAAGIRRSLKYRLGAPNPAWTKGTSPSYDEQGKYLGGGVQVPGTGTGPDNPAQYTFGGGSFEGGQAGFGLQGQLSALSEMKDLTKSLRALNETMIKADRGYQAQQAGFALESANMSYRQGLENIALQERQFQVQRAFQTNEMSIQGRQMQITQGWQRQDLSFQQSVAGLQYGWGQEDYTRNIRFATGRERQQLRREQGRAQVMYSMEEGQRGRERERFEEQAQWQREALERQRAHYEQMSQLQVAHFAMQRRHLTEQHDLQVRQIAAQMAHMNEMYGLQDAQRKLEQDWQDRQQDYQKTQIEKEMELAKLEAADAEAQLGLEKDLALARGKYTQEQLAPIEPGGTLWEAWQKFVDQMATTINDLKRLAGGGNGSGSGSSTQPPSQSGTGEQTLAGPLLPTFTPQRGSTGGVQVRVYLGTRELEELMVEVARQPVFLATTQDNGRRLSNRRLA